MRWMRAFSIVSVVAAITLVGTASAEARHTGPVINWGNIPVGSCHERYGIVFYGCVVKTAVFRNKTDHPVRFNELDGGGWPFFAVYDTNTCEQPVEGPWWIIPVGGRCSIQMSVDPQSPGTQTGVVQLVRDGRVIREKILVVTGVQ